MNDCAPHADSASCTATAASGSGTGGHLRSLIASLAVLYVLTGCVTTTGAFEQAMSSAADIIDLTHPLSTQTPAADGVPFQVVAARTIERDGYEMNRFAMSEASGTNIETSARFVTGSVSVDRLPNSLLMGYGVLVDVTKAVAQNPGYKVSRSDLETWESENGAIPAESIVLIRTGWSERWSTPDRYLNTGADGRPVYPGVATDAVEFLIRERRVHALGIDTLSTYAGSGNEAEQRGFLNTGKFHINNLTGLDQVPARGAFIIATPLKIKGGTGSPARVLAIVPQKQNAVEPGKKKVQQETNMGGSQGNPAGQRGPGGY